MCGSPIRYSTRVPRPSDRRWKVRHHESPGGRTPNRRQPGCQHRHLRAVRRHHAVRGDPGGPQEVQRRRVLHRRTRVLRPAERHRDRRRLPFGRQLSRHRGRHRRLRLRRLPVLHRLPGGLAGGAAPGRRIAAQHRQIHHGRRAELPAQAAARAVGRGDFDDDRVAVLSAGADGRRRRAGRAAARHQGTQRPERS